MRFREWFGSKSKVETKSIPSGISDPADWLLETFGVSASSSGVNVGPNNAMNCAAVSCAVKAIAETIGQLPFPVYGRDENGVKSRAPQHPVNRLTSGEVNDWTSANEFRETLTIDALLNEQGGFAHINRVDGRPIELTRLAPDTVSIEIDRKSREPFYRVTLGNRRSHVLPYSDVFHLRGVGSPVKQAREAIALAMVMEQHAGRLFGNGARPGGIITFKDRLDPESLAKAKAAWQAAHGNGNNGGTAVLDREAGFTPVTLSSVDAQFAELRSFAILEIARAFRVPPVLLMDYARQTWANAETGGQQFLTFTLEPWLKRWEAETRLKLFSPEERDTHFAEFLTDGLLRSDFEKRSKSYSQAIASRWMNPNEVRALENMPPYEGGDEFINPHVTPGTSNSDTPNNPETVQ